MESLKTIIKSSLVSKVESARYVATTNDFRDLLLTTTTELSKSADSYVSSAIGAWDGFLIRHKD